MITTVILIAIINFLAAFFQGSTGFGYAVLSMGLMPFLIPVANGAAICAVNGIAIGIQMMIALHKYVNRQVVLIPVLCCFATIPVGLILLHSYDEMILRVILACLLVLITMLFYVLHKKNITLPAKWYIAAAFGLITGISTGMFSIVGPFLMIYYINVCKEPLELKACLEFSFLSVSIYLVVSHVFVYHTFQPSDLPVLAGAVVGALLAGRLGLKLYKHINKEIITKIIYFILPIMAIMLVVNAYR